MGTEPRRRLPVLPTSIPFEGDASPCQAHACRACCFDTEMPLLEEDVARLQRVSGRRPDGFSVPDPDTGGRRLRNVHGQCVFLGPHGCTVYVDRPAGCRIYPLVWDAEADAPVLDDGCPYRDRFRPSDDDVAALRTLVDRILGAC